MILKQSIHFQYNGNGDGFVIREEVTNWCSNILNPAIDTLLKQYEETAEIIQLDKLELSIDLNSTKNWQAALNEKLIQRLKEELELKIQVGKNIVNLRSATNGFSGTLIYFLKYGILPWNSRVQTKGELETEFDKWVVNMPGSEKENFLNALKDKNAALRLNNLLNEERFEIFFENAVSNKSMNIAVLLNDAKFVTKLVSKDDNMQRNMLRDLKEGLLSALHLQQDHGFENEVIKQWFYQIKQDGQQFQKTKIAEIKSSFIRNMLTQNMPGQEKITEVHRVNNKNDKPGRTGIDEMKSELADGIFINNAGAVIIAPFLPGLFSNTGLLKDGNKIDDFAALCLVHYCITGNVNPEEFDLLLPKLLCGIEPEKAVVSPRFLHDETLHEANEMLSSAILHWSVLKNTSIDGFRESFLKRNGKLSYKDGVWLLQVEPRAYDMLLEHLPWSISLIKLPWMNNLLKTEWSY